MSESIDFVFLMASAETREDTAIRPAGKDWAINRPRPGSHIVCVHDNVFIAPSASHSSGG